MLRKLIPFCALALASMGCTRHANHELATSLPPTDGRAPQEARAEAPPARGWADDRAKSSAAGARDSSYEAAPSQRPGLATTFGESHTSHVSSVFFERQDPSQPSAWARLVYDDMAGVARATGGAWPARPSQVPLLGGALFIGVADEARRPLPAVDGPSGTYVIASRDERYLISVENRTSTRFEIVATVDGLDVIDGRPGALEKRGYLVNPHDTLWIEGFRTSDSDVAAFRFGSVEESYAASQGVARNVGVIGVAAFAERAPAWPEPNGPYAVPPRYYYDEDATLRRNAEPFPGRYASPPMR
jgi:hypothetical protein